MLVSLSFCTIVYTSKYFQPRSETFSERYHFIGPSIRPITNPIEKTSEKTVYISMGTVNQNREFYRSCIHALGKTDWQVILSMGTNTEHFEHLPENVQVYESVDQMAVLSVAMPASRKTAWTGCFFAMAVTTSSVTPLSKHASR